MIRRLKWLTLLGLVSLCPPTLARDAGYPTAAAASLATDAGAAAALAGSPAEPARALLAEADAAYRRRDEPGELDNVKQKLEAAEKLAPSDYGVLWRLARYYFWLSDDPEISDDERSRLGKKAWEYGDRATQANPNRVEGWFFAAGGMGNYSLGIGILKALSQGIEGKFKDRLSHAERIDPTFYNGAVYNAWGRFYFKLPWPKYDARKSELYLLKAIQMNRANVRARVYLAELYTKEDHPKEARTLLEQALAQPPGAYDSPEERRYQKQARALLARTK